jgi:hypothetical protein
MTTVSFGFAFLEYQDAQTAAYYLPYLQRSGMKIDGRPVQFDYAKPGSFSTLERQEYWDPNACVTVYPSAKDFQDHPSVLIGKSDQPDDEKDLEENLADLYADLDAVVAKSDGGDENTDSDRNKELSSAAAVSSKPPPTPPSMPEDDEQWTDWDRLACLLCERQFATAADLRRHQSQSELHLTNRERHITQLYEAYYAQLGVEGGEGRDGCAEDESGSSDGDDGPEETGEKQRRPKRLSRRKQRALKYNQSLLEQGYLPAQEARLLLQQQRQQSSAPAPTESTTQLKQGVGGRLLAKMGWREGEGLGRDKSGIVTPISAETYAVRGAGLGTVDLNNNNTNSSSSSVVSLPAPLVGVKSGDDYKSRGRSKTYERFYSGSH